MLKKIIAFVCIALFLYGCAETAESVLNRSVEAAGGKEKYNEMKTMKIDIKLTVMGMELPMKMFTKDKVKMRMEMSIMGQNMITVVTDKSGWISQNGAISDIPADQLEGARQQFKTQGGGMNSDLMNWKEMGYSLELVDEDEVEVEGSPAYKIKMTKEGNETFQYIDKATFLATKISTKADIQGNDMEIEVLMKDYKEVSGLKIPHLMKIKSGGQDMGQAIIESVKINEPVDDKLFEKP